ncbi:hypothetical protein P245_19765 [Comamonas thiooxydans]|uniref:Uncharacterized protein n=1 Tax=Comamonas thiooxydans TaxID=363952 RepID=A0A0E3BYG3_9BURK|nr:hypothetical protein [Comamonas thiooxydans]KGG87691.1 hypothetical protein P245_19765 [Comamonas thiooxydans]
MKSLRVAIVIVGVAFSAVAAQATNPDSEEIKTVAEVATLKVLNLVKTAEPVSIGQGKYEVSVTVADKACKATLQPSPDDDMGQWRWKVSVLNCPGK